MCNAAYAVCAGELLAASSPPRVSVVWARLGWLGYDAVARFCPLTHWHALTLLVKGKVFTELSLPSTVERLPFPRTFSRPSEAGWDRLNLPHCVAARYEWETRSAKASIEGTQPLANSHFLP